MVHIFIVNPQAGPSDKTEKIRAYLERRKDIKSIIFITEEPGCERKFVRNMLDIFDDEPVRIYICGGSGTLSNAIDAIREDEFENVEVAFFPCGYTNDYLKNFGETKALFTNIDELIDGKSVYVDFIKCIANDKEDQIHNEILFSALGVIANVEITVKNLRILGGVSPDFMYTLASVLRTPTSFSVDYELYIDGVDYSKEYKQIYVANSVCLGGHHFPIRKDIDCRDGYLNVLLIKKMPMYKSLKYYAEFAHGIVAEKHPDDVVVMKCKEIYVKRKDGKPMNINSDGELDKVESWKMSVAPAKLRFVIPQKARFEADVDKMVECMTRC